MPHKKKAIKKYEKQEIPNTIKFVGEMFYWMLLRTRKKPKVANAQFYCVHSTLLLAQFKAYKSLEYLKR